MLCRGSRALRGIALSADGIRMPAIFRDHHSVLAGGGDSFVHGRYVCIRMWKENAFILSVRVPGPGWMFVAGAGLHLPRNDFHEIFIRQHSRPSLM